MLHTRLPLPAFRTIKNFIHGPNSIAALRGLECTRATLVVGKSLTRQTKLFDKLKRNIRCQHLDVIEKSWTGEPSLADLKKPMQQLEKNCADVIIAVGGGSIMDAAKLMWMFYEHPDLDRSLYTRAFAIPSLRGRTRFVCVPTTTGTGSEVSSSALFLDEETGRKISVVTHDFLPDVAILDPEFVENMPTSVMIATVCDALSHAIEGYVSRLDNPLMDVMAEKAVQMIFENWQVALEGGDVRLNALSNLQYAATMAGWVQNHKLAGASHAIAHQLANFGVPHGNANAILLPSVIRFNARDEQTARKFERLSHLCGVGQAPEDLACAVETIRQSGGFDLRLSTYGKFDRSWVAAHALEDPTAPFNPVTLVEETVLGILEACQ